MELLRNLGYAWVVPMLMKFGLEDFVREDLRAYGEEFFF